MPFVIHALPRSRTVWLSAFLTYGGWHCGHDELMHVRSLEDVRSWFAQPCTGTVETAAAPWWRLVPRGVRTVVVRRPAADVRRSCERMGYAFDPAPIARKLDQIEARTDCLSVQFADLNRQSVCARIFEHCLQLPHDPAWWTAMAPINIQRPVLPSVRYFQAHERQLTRAAAEAKNFSLAMMRLKDN